MADIFMMKGADGAFHMSDTQSVEHGKNLKIGEPYKFVCTKPRNYKFHKKYFAMLNMAFENQEKYDAFEHFRDAVTMQAGWYKTIISVRTGEPMYVPKSISFSSMEEIEFVKLYNNTLNVILKYFMKGTTQEELERILNFR
jgi:hypothetical protein